MKESKIYSGWNELPNELRVGTIQQGCLALEGGAFRGVYNQGLLDAFIQNDVNIQTVIGVSAGAMEGVNYAAGHAGRAARLNLRYRHDSRYIGLKAFFRSRSPVNVDFALRDYNEIDPICMENLIDPRRRFLALATDCRTGKPVCFDRENCSDIMTAVKASASMPYISPMVSVDGVPCLDGGCSCSIPYRWALEKGFEKIVIVKTRERGYRKEEKESKVPGIFYHRFPEFAEQLRKKNFAYNKECDEVDELEKSGRAFVIAPSKPVTVGRLERDTEKIGELYWLGYHDALDCMEALKAYLKG